MFSRDRLNLAQRIVVVVALGAALRIVGWWLLEEHDSFGAGGWTTYTPNSVPLMHTTDERFSPLVVAVGYLVLTLAWSAASVWVFGRGSKADTPEDPQ